MYSRSFTDDAGLIIPESYSGTAFREPPSESAETASEPMEDENVEVSGAGKEESVETGGFLSSIFDKLSSGNLFGGLGGGKFKLSHIGAEEILIIAAAAFLFFSGDGDKECALMLIALLFIT